MRAFLTLWLVFLFAATIVAQEAAPNYSHVTITLTMDGTHCGCALSEDSEVQCCPNYSASVNENGTVTYDGGFGAKVRGSKVHSIPTRAVRDLVADFFRVDFFSREDRYVVNKSREVMTVDHSYAATISIDIDGQRKSVYLFYGEPQELDDLRRKLFDTLQIAPYVGRT
jgi:hypothetical protein